MSVASAAAVVSSLFSVCFVCATVASLKWASHAKGEEMKETQRMACAEEKPVCTASMPKSTKKKLAALPI